MKQDIKWTKEKPTKPGLYWFYGDIFWGCINQNPEKFKPELEIVKCTVLNKITNLVCNGNFVDKQYGFGLYSVEPIEIPELSEIEKPYYTG